MAYIAAATFIDDDLTIYHKGDAFPRAGKPDAGRVAQLSADGLIRESGEGKTKAKKSK